MKVPNWFKLLIGEIDNKFIPHRNQLTINGNILDAQSMICYQTGSQTNVVTDDILNPMIKEDSYKESLKLDKR